MEKLSNENGFPKIISNGETWEGHLYIVMEKLGPSLKNLRKKFK